MTRTRRKGRTNRAASRPTAFIVRASRKPVSPCHECGVCEDVDLNIVAGVLVSISILSCAASGVKVTSDCHLYGSGRNADFVVGESMRLYRKRRLDNRLGARASDIVAKFLRGRIVTVRNPSNESR